VEWYTLAAIVLIAVMMGAVEVEECRPAGGQKEKSQ